MVKTCRKLLLLFLCTPFFSSCQIPNVYDGRGGTNYTRSPIPYPYLREADVLWRHRVWEVIDLKQKVNHPLYYPLDSLVDRLSLWRVILNGLREQTLTAYSLGPTLDDEFQYPMSLAAIDSAVYRTETVYVPELESGNVKEVSVTMEIPSSDIVAYKLKEDWIFDKQRSERYVRIIGIAPMVAYKSESTGELKGVKEIFWLYFPECRYTFCAYDVFNRGNDSQRISFDDLFHKRFFSAYVVKEENVYNRQIEDYQVGVDAMLESERIKNAMFTMEHDLWNY
jgi:gliding motility associated protien GldN